MPIWVGSLACVTRLSTRSSQMKSNDKLSVCLVLMWTANLFVACDETQPANDGLLMLSYDSGIAQEPDAQAIVDLGNVSDQGVDSSPEPVILDAPEARVYANDPVTDDGQLSDVTLTRSIHEEGRLTSPGLRYSIASMRTAARWPCRTLAASILPYSFVTKFRPQNPMTRDIFSASNLLKMTLTRMTNSLN